MKKQSDSYKFFLIALLVHVIILAVLANIYIISPYTMGSLLKGKLKEKREAAPPPKRETPTIEKSVTAEVPVHLLKKKPEMAVDVRLDRKVKVPTTAKVPETVLAKDAKVSMKYRAKSDRIVTKERARRRTAYKQFAKKFETAGRGKAVRAIFTPVLVQYSGGDWNKDQKSLPNLMRGVNERSNIKAVIKPKVVGAASKEIFDCPFVFFTGTKDFRFTEEEVYNLRKYLLQGGFVWADNGLPGRRSRFDIAFRREMKRVLPDRNFEIIPNDHLVFSSFYKIKKVPSAMNYRDDPLEMMRIDKRVAVIYTLNDYVAFWRTRIDEKGNLLPGYDEDWQRMCGPYWISGDRWRYENLSKGTVDAAYRLGMNIVAYLLTR